jgi:hypothetical protein
MYDESQKSLPVEISGKLVEKIRTPINTLMTFGFDALRVLSREGEFFLDVRYLILIASFENVEISAVRAYERDVHQ